MRGFQRGPEGVEIVPLKRTETIPFQRLLAYHAGGGLPNQLPLHEGRGLRVERVSKAVRNR